MGIKIKLITGLFFLLVFSAGVLPVFSDDNIVRVGLTDNKFQNVLKQEVTVYGTAECDICDKETRKIIANTAENTEIIIKNGEVGLDLTIKGKTTTLRKSGRNSRIFKRSCSERNACKIWVGSLESSGCSCKKLCVNAKNTSL